MVPSVLSDLMYKLPVESLKIMHEANTITQQFDTNQSYHAYFRIHSAVINKLSGLLIIALCICDKSLVGMVQYLHWCIVSLVYSVTSYMYALVVRAQRHTVYVNIVDRVSVSPSIHMFVFQALHFPQQLKFKTQFTI